MVIQRLQTVFLLLAAIVMGVMCFCVPIGSSPVEGVAPLYVTDQLPLLILVAVSTVLLVVDIFLFKNLKLQMKGTKLIMFFVVAIMALGAFVLFYRLPEPFESLWIGATAMMVVAFVLTILAYRRMDADRKLLSSYDRLR